MNPSLHGEVTSRLLRDYAFKQKRGGEKLEAGQCPSCGKKTLWAFGEATDALFRYVGDDEDYRAAGLTFFTAETHVNYFREMRSGEPMRFETQLVGLDPKRMHVFHRMIHGRTGDLVATNEIMLLHVDTKTRRTAPMRADVHSALEAVWKEHKKLSKPRELGRTMKVGGAKKLSQSRQRGRRR